MITCFSLLQLVDHKHTSSQCFIIICIAIRCIALQNFADNILYSYYWHQDSPCLWMLAARVIQCCDLHVLRYSQGTKTGFATH